MRENLIEMLREELGRFSDPGADSLDIASQAGIVKVTMTRNGRGMILSSSDFYAAPITLEFDDNKRMFSSYRALLASDLFADIPLWGKRQRDVLGPKFHGVIHIEPHGFLSPSGAAIDSFEAVDKYVAGIGQVKSAVRVLLIDGPAGVGKTHLIERLSLSSAMSAATNGSRLFLHVKSRGKVLSNIDDLMAFSLQSLRLSVTFDQVPVLVRHGLVILAIDGFDELGDPEGFNHAWGQVNDLINFVKHDATVVLAGRETFIGRERLIRSVATLNKDADVVELSLDETPPHKAEQWLREIDVDGAAVDLLKQSGLLEHGSFALRPFFLWHLAKQIEGGEGFLEKQSGLSDVLPTVVSLMVDREARRFRGEIVSALTEQGVVEFIWRFLSEVAREMAGDQSEAISETMLGWIVDMVLPAGVDSSIVSLLKVRAPAMAFLALDERSGYRKFGHSQFFNYFLARSVIDAVRDGDVPKWLRRGVVNADFLVAFVPYLRAHASDQQLLCNFRNQLARLMDEAKSSTVGVQLPRNLAALMFSTLALSKRSDEIEVRSSEIQYAYAGTGTFKARIAVDFIHLLDGRSCDFTEVVFEDTRIGTLLVDGATVFGSSVPEVIAVRCVGEDGSAKDVFEPEKVREVMKGLSGEEGSARSDGSDAMALLDKLVRSRRYWFKPDDDDLFGNFDDLAGWPELRAALERHSMIRVENNRQASGSRADWIHIKNARAILLRDTTNVMVKALLEDLG